MPFCVKCGKQLSEGTRFCTGCGTPVGGEAENDGTKRVQKFEGEIRKCPNCGTVLESFQAVCPSCGFEFRGSTKVASSVQKLTDKIAEIERTREENGPDIVNKGWDSQIKTSANKTDVSIANLIKVFPVPNTIEEILEFVMLAVSNIDSTVLGKAPRPNGFIRSDEAGQKAISEAWRSKMEQMYKKASMSFASSPKFQEVKMLYDEKQAEIKKAKIKGIFLSPSSITTYIFISVNSESSVAETNVVETSGAESSVAETSSTNQIQQVETEIHKCPNCGAVLESFQAVCPSCGFELRGDIKTASSVEKFTEKIQEIESTRENEDISGKKSILT